MRASPTEKCVPERELPWVDSREIVWVLSNDKFFEHADRLVSADPDRKGTLRWLAVDHTENGYMTGHCVLRWR